MQTATIRIIPPQKSRWAWLWTFRRKTFPLQLPEDWQEVAADKILPCLKVLSERGGDSQKTALQLLKILLPLRRWIFFRITAVDYWEKLIPCIDWMLSEPITQPILPTIVHQQVTYYLPMYELRNMCLAEYAQADDAYLKIVQHQDDAAINELAAVLLREEGNREIWSEFDLKRQSALFVSLSDEEKFYLAYFFTCCKNRLAELYPEAFKSKKPKDGKSTDTDNWHNVFTDIAENQIFGSVQDVQRINVHTFFRWIGRQQRKIEEQERERLQEIIKQNHQKFLA